MCAEIENRQFDLKLTVFGLFNRRFVRLFSDSCQQKKSLSYESKRIKSIGNINISKALTSNRPVSGHLFVKRRDY